MRQFKIKPLSTQENPQFFDKKDLCEEKKKIPPLIVPLFLVNAGLPSLTRALQTCGISQDAETSEDDRLCVSLSLSLSGAV